MCNKLLGIRKGVEWKDTLLAKRTLLGEIIVSLLLVTGYKFRMYSIGKIAMLSLYFLPGWILTDILAHFDKGDFNAVERIVVSFCLSVALNIGIFSVVGIFGAFSLFFVSSFAFTLSLLFFHIYLSCSSKRVTKQLEKKKEGLLIAALMLLFFAVAFLMRNFHVLRFPDEIGYIYDVRNILVHGFFNSPVKNPLRYVLLSSFGFFLNLTSVNFWNVTLVAFTFYVMLIPATYLLGSLYNRRVGIYASLFTPLLPALFYWNNRFMPDIPLTVFTTLTLYFFFRMQKRSEKMKANATMFLISYLLGLFTKISILLLVIPLFLSFSFTKEEKKGRTKHLFFSLIFLFSAFVVFLIFTQWHNPLTLFKGFSTILSMSPNQWYHFFFVRPNGAYGTWVYPYFYTHSIIFLALVGIVHSFMQTDDQKRNPAFVFLIVTILYFGYFSFRWLHPIMHSKHRQVFPVYPLIAVFASKGFLSRKKGLLLVFPLVFIPSLFGGSRVFPFSVVQHGYLYAHFSGVLAVLVLLWKVLRNWKGNFFQKISFFFSIPQKKLMVGFGVLLVLLNLFWYSSYFTYHSWESDNVTPETVKLQQCAAWINQHAPPNATIMTNINPKRLGYYTKYRETIRPPPSKGLFLKKIEEKSFDFLVLYRWEHLHWDKHFPTYLENYFNTHPRNMTKAERVEGEGDNLFVIYKR